MRLLQVAGWLTGVWAVYMTLGSVAFVLWTRWRLQRDAIGWLRRRGVASDSREDLTIMWLEGQVAFPNYIKIPVVAAVLTPDHLDLECQVPTFFRRGRQVIPAETVLRVIDGAIADPKRRCRVASRPAGVLTTRLRDHGWRMKEVQF